MQKYFTILTRLGREKIASAQVNGTPIFLTEMAIGSSTREPLETYIALENEKWRGPINQLKVDPANPHWIIAETHVPADVGGWMVREIGLIDMDGDLIVIGRQPDTYKPNLGEGTAKELIIKLIIEVSNTECIDLSIDPSTVMASREYVDNKYSETVKRLEERMDAFQSEVQQKIDGLSSMTDMLAKGLQRVMIILELDGKTQGGYGFFDDFEGTPKAMQPLTQQLILEKELPAGTTEIEQDGTIFKVGEDLTIFDDENQEEIQVLNISSGLVVTELQYHYKKGAIITGSTQTKLYTETDIKGVTAHG